MSFRKSPLWRIRPDSGYNFNSKMDTLLHPACGNFNRGVGHFQGLPPSGIHLMGGNKPLLIKWLFRKFIYIWSDFVNKNRLNSVSSRAAVLHCDHSTRGSERKWNVIPALYWCDVNSKKREGRTLKTKMAKGVGRSSKVGDGTFKSSFLNVTKWTAADHRSPANSLVIFLFSFIPVSLMWRLQ